MRILVAISAPAAVGLDALVRDLTKVTKSLRESRRYRKLAEMYWALALGKKPESVQSSKIIKTTRT
jgi:hypothetical protein